jgi:AraC family transcriptional regulator
MSGLVPNRFEDGTPILLAGLRRRHEFPAAEIGIPQQWKEFGSHERIPGQISTKRYGVMCGSDSTGIEYMCGVEVESFIQVPAGVGRMRVPSQRYAVFTHLGHGSTLLSTWKQILGWLSGGSYQSAHLPDFEIYEANANPLAPQPGIEVWVGVVPRGQPDA